MSHRRFSMSLRVFFVAVWVTVLAIVLAVALTAHAAVLDLAITGTMHGLAVEGEFVFNTTQQTWFVDLWQVNGAVIRGVLHLEGTALKVGTDWVLTISSFKGVSQVTVHQNANQTWTQTVATVDFQLTSAKPR